MHQDIYTDLKHQIRRNKWRSIFKRVVSILACTVMFCTTYALILPAITMEQTTFCGVEEHSHSEKCYTAAQQKRLICNAEHLDIHTHSDSCYGPEGNPVCGLCDYVAHSHDTSCFNAAEELVCTLAERSVHVHDDSCYEPGETLPEVLHVHSDACNVLQRGELICIQEELEGHAHGDACYEPSDVLLCIKQENHSHVESCYETPLICTQSTEPHAHSADCNGRGELICATAENHVHDDACVETICVCEKTKDVHSHGNECYSRKTTCSLPENHVHGDACTETICVCENTEEDHSHGNECYSIKTTCKLPENHIHGDACTEMICICEKTEEDHSHGNECYSSKTTCTLPENHNHNDACYESIVACGKAEGECHSHDSGCYGEQKLICTEDENHVHGDSCYEPRQICTTDEIPGHAHGDDCYEQVTVIGCGLNEGEPEPTEPVEPVLACTEPAAQVHVHGDGCFETVTVDAAPICGNTDEGHTHEITCYELQCGLEEHEHSLACYSDPEADLESRETWEATMASVTLTGDWPTDVVAIAKTQLGYTESTRNYAVWEDGSIHGYTRYGAWYGVPYGDWCGMFASFCLRYAGVDSMPINYGVRPWIDELADRGLYFTAQETKPQVGSLIFYDWEGDGLSDHVGIVAEVQEAQEHTGASVKAIEGNSSNCVRYVSYSVTDPVILGYGLLPGQERIPVEAPSDEVPEDSALDILICGTPGHVHGDSCYDEEGTLICEKQEHLHSISCVDPSSPVGHASAGQMLRLMRTGVTPRLSDEVFDITPLLDKILIYDSQNNVVYNSADSTVGTGQVKLGENCRIKLFFKESEQIQFSPGADAVFTYTIPSNLVSEIVETGVIVNEEDDSVVANYIINNNLLTITPVVPDGEEVNFFGKFGNADLDIEFDAEVLQTSGSEGTDLDFSDNFDVKINVVEEGYLNAEKECLSYDPDTREITYKCKVTAHGGTVRIDKLEDYCWGIDGSLIRIDQNTLTLTDTNGNNIKNQWYIGISDSQGIWMWPYDQYQPFQLRHNESITLSYKIVIDDSVDFNFNHGNGFYVHGNNGKDDLYDEEVIYTPIQFTNVEKTGAIATEELNGQTVNVLQWTVAIENEALEKITMRDQLSEGQIFCEHKNIVMEAFKPDGSANYFTITWDDVKNDNTKTWFEYELPEGYSSYRLRYYSHYEFDENGDAFQTFENTVTTTIDGKDDSFDGTGSVGVLGVPPGIDKTIPDLNDQWVTFRVECSVPGALYNMPNVLFYDTLASWGGEPGYVQQHPDSLTVTITPEGGEPYTLQPYSEGGPTENTYLLVEDGQTFVLYFNTSQASGETSVWKCDVDSTLTVTYRISLDSPMLDGWGGEPNGETLRQFYERIERQAFTNSAALTYSAKDEVEDSINWTPPRRPDPHLTKNASPTDDDGVYSYSVWFNSGDGESSVFHKGVNNLTDVQSFVLEDVFDSRMLYEENSLYVSIWEDREDSGPIMRFELDQGQTPAFTQTADGKTCMTVSADNLICVESTRTSYLDKSLLYIIQHLPLNGYQYEFSYQLMVKDEVKVAPTDRILRLDNTAYINWTDSEGPKTVDPAHSHVNYDTGVLDKTMEEVEGRNVVTCTILVNQNALNLTGIENGSYVLYDTMSSNLTLMYNTLVVEVLNKDNGVLEKKLTLEECKFSYDPDQNQMIFNLPDEKVIRLTYNCRVTSNGEDTTHISNVVELHGRSTMQDFVDTEFEIKDHQGSAGGSNTKLKFHLQKQDGNNHNTLAGVTFHLYGAIANDSDRPPITVNDKVLYYYGSYTTGPDGIAVISHDLLAAGYLYALVEDAPPSGYVALSEPYVFYMENPPEGMTTDIDIVFNEAIQVVKNYPIGYRLPETGGSGTTPYTMAGLMLMLFSAAFLMYSHPKRRREVL